MNIKLFVLCLVLIQKSTSPGGNKMSVLAFGTVAAEANQLYEQVESELKKRSPPTDPRFVEKVNQSEKCGLKYCACLVTYSWINENEYVGAKICKENQICSQVLNEAACVKDSIIQDQQCGSYGCDCVFNDPLTRVRSNTACAPEEICSNDGNKASCAASRINENEKCRQSSCICGGVNQCSLGEYCLKDGYKLSCFVKQNKIQPGKTCNENFGCSCSKGSHIRKCQKKDTCFVDSNDIPFCAYVEDPENQKTYTCENRNDCVCAFKITTTNEIKTKTCIGGHECVLSETNDVQCTFPMTPMRVELDQVCISKKGKCYIWPEGKAHTYIKTGEICNLDQSNKIKCTQQYKSFECKFKGECECGDWVTWSEGNSHCNIFSGLKPNSYSNTGNPDVLTDDIIATETKKLQDAGRYGFNSAEKIFYV